MTEAASAPVAGVFDRSLDWIVANKLRVCFNRVCESNFGAWVVQTRCCPWRSCLTHPGRESPQATFYTWAVGVGGSLVSCSYLGILSSRQ